MTQRHDPAIIIARELGTLLKYEHHREAVDWVAAAPHETQQLTRVDILWSGVAPIACAWLQDVPLFAVPLGTSDRNVLRPIAVFIGESPRYKPHQGLMWVSVQQWAQRWCAAQPQRLGLLFERDMQAARAWTFVYAPSDGDIVVDYWRSLNHAPERWRYSIVNPDRPDPPATYRPKPPGHLSN